MNNIPTIVFLGLGPSDMKRACEIYAGASLDNVEKVINNYASTRLMHNEYNYEYINIGQILYDDCNFTNDDINTTYHDLCNKYGQDFMDIIVTKDNDKVVENITNCINFMFDKVYKTDIMKIVMYHVIGTKNEKTKFPTLIYSAIQQNFIIKEHILSGTIFNSILIEKKENTNVYNAN